MGLFEIFLSELAKALKFPTLSPDSRGACLIVMREEHIPLLFEVDDKLVPNTIILSSSISPISFFHRFVIYEALMKHNCLSENILSVKPDEEMLYLHRRIHPSIQAPELNLILQSFLETIRLWYEKLELITKSPPLLPPRTSPSSLIQVFPYKA